MSSISQKHLSGITFDHMVVRELRFIDNLESGQRDAYEGLQIGIELKSQVSVDKSGCRTLLKVTIRPAEGKDSFQMISAVVEGYFSAQGETTVALDEFASKQAPAILMPFLRTEVAGLTAKSRYGQLLLPPINVVALAEQIEKERSEAKS